MLYLFTKPFLSVTWYIGQIVFPAVQSAAFRIRLGLEGTVSSLAIESIKCNLITFINIKFVTIVFSKTGSYSGSKCELIASTPMSCLPTYSHVPCHDSHEL